MKLLLALLLAAGAAGLSAAQSTPSPGTLELIALSSDPALVTGGDVLVQIAAPAGVRLSTIKVSVAGRDVTAAFSERKGRQPLMAGVVTGLALGPNVIEATGPGELRGSLRVTNYPATGPVVSGPWQQPFVCQTEAFVLPDGSTLGPATDANCSARTVVQYVYKSSTPPPPQAETADTDVDGTTTRRTAPWYKPLPAGTALPADVATTVTTDGTRVPFIVRVETGTMNRGIYQNAMLHDPTRDPAPGGAGPYRGWNGRLLAVHGSGCPGGWYVQGAALGVSVLDEARLAQGYAVFNNTLNHPTNSCNAFLAGETTMMGKEHFIEEFGVPRYTISYGGSGGAYTSLQIADAFPGLIDGVEIRATFPDALSIAMSGLDAHLLWHFFTTTRTSFTDLQKVTVSGYQGMKAFLDAANQSQRTDPIASRNDADGYQAARWNAAVPEDARYHSATNPQGARPTVFDAARNIYGVNLTTGAALRPFDNTGVQYGLAALNAGIITAQQFLDLNAGIGGVDADDNYVAERTAGDETAIRRAYQSGLMLGANGGLRSIPIVDNATSNELSGYHYGWFHFALRERIRKANNGDAATMMMWRSTTGNRVREVFDRWMDAYTADKSALSTRDKVLKHRPAEAVDGCYDRSTPPRFLADPLPFSSKPVSPCTERYPVYSNPRHEAGGPLAADVLKCQLKPIDDADYAVPLSFTDRARLTVIFPAGVCDWSKPGVAQAPVVPWVSFGPSPRNRLDDPPSTAGR